MGQFQKGTFPHKLRQASRALPSHGGMAASSQFQTSSGDPPSAPEASGEAGTLVLAQETTFQSTPHSCQPYILGSMGKQGLQDAQGEEDGGGADPPTHQVGLRSCLFPTVTRTQGFSSTGQMAGGQCLLYFLLSKML